MPNLCENVLILKHKNPEMIERADSALSKDSFLQEFLPVPDDCSDIYGFCCNNWGTKWDVLDSCSIGGSESELIYGFDTAWCPPIVAYQKLEAMGFDITAYYYESGMGFCGSYVDGEENYYDIDGDSNWVIANIPRDIDDEFAISENMAYYESDENILKSA